MPECAPEQLLRGERETLRNRKSVTVKRYWSGGSLFTSVRRYDDGRVGEIFVSAGRVGSQVQSLLSSIGILASLALQYGAPADRVASAIATRQDEMVDMIAEALAESAEPVSSVPAE